MTDNKQKAFLKQEALLAWLSNQSWVESRRSATVGGGVVIVAKDVPYEGFKSIEEKGWTFVSYGPVASQYLESGQAARPRRFYLKREGNDG